MKKNFAHILIVTAAAFMLGATANAQTGLVAKVPFSFRVNGSVLPAGNYELKTAWQGSVHVVVLQSAVLGKSATAITTTLFEREATTPQLLFLCGETNGCYLSTARDQFGVTFQLPKPRRKSAESETTWAIALLPPDAR